MSRHQAVQARLRNELQQVHIERYQDDQMPEMEEITQKSIPYLDAVVEETLRYASVATLIVRTTLCDTQIFGYAIPKGTDVLLPLTGPSMTEPALEVPEAWRSSTSQKARERVPSWGQDMHEYKPERWLKWQQGEDGAPKEVFDPHAGPNLAFSTGPRQCFGKKLAYMKLRTFMTMLIWNFEFGEVAPGLDGDETIERLVNLPKNCYVRLSTARGKNVKS